MARWIPKSGDPIGPSEHIGRRIFERSDLYGARDQEKPIGEFAVSHFEDRQTGEVSVDRLGKTGIEKAVTGYLNLCAEEHAKSFKPIKLFLGWAVVKAKELQNPTKGDSIPLIASPTSADDGAGISENPYHAHATPINGLSAYTMSVLLAHIFNKHHRFETKTQRSTANDDNATDIKQ